MSVESEMLRATDQKERKDGEDEQKYLRRIALASNDIPDAKWNELSTEAQEWMNAAAEAYEKKQALPPFGDEPAEAEEEANEPAEANDDAAPAEEAEAAPASAPAASDAKKAGKKAGKKAETAEAPKPAAEAPKPAKAKKGGKAEATANGDKRGGTSYMYDAICEDPTITPEALKAKLAAEGFKITDITFNAAYYTAKSIIRRLSDGGMLKKKVNA